PAEFEAGDSAAIMLGAVLSRLIATEAAAVFPALSRPVPVVVWLAASVATVTGAEHVSMPLNASVHVKAIITLELFQPNAFGTGDRAAVTVGTVLSRFTAIEVFEANPAWFTAVPVTG